MALSEPRTRPADRQRVASRLSLFDPRWVDFVQTHPQALIFHRPAWAEMIASSYGYERSRSAFSTTTSRSRVACL